MVRRLVNRVYAKLLFEKRRGPPTFLHPTDWQATATVTTKLSGLFREHSPMPLTPWLRDPQAEVLHSKDVPRMVVDEVSGQVFVGARANRAYAVKVLLGLGTPFGVFTREVPLYDSGTVDDDVNWQGSFRVRI